MRFHSSVDSNVHVVGDPLIETLATFCTAILLTVTMNLHMGAQVSAVVKVFAAFWTGGCEFPGALVNASVVLVIS